jgi:hypothetical protein
MSDGKGKGRAAAGDEEQAAPTPQAPSQTPSLLDRVVASAAGLGRSTFGAPSSNESSEIASAALGGSEKGQSTSGSSAVAWTDGSNSAAHYNATTQQAQNFPSFRSLHQDEHIQRTEGEFSSFLDGIDPFTPSSTESEVILPHQVSLERVWNNAVPSDHAAREYTSVEEQQMRDGEGVLNLLNEPGSAMELLDSTFSEDEVVKWNLTDGQLMVLRGMVNELFPPGELPVAPPADHPLNLIPVAESLAGDEGRQMWIEQWNGVLTRYTDEVWGDLLPLVEEAREEVQSIEDGMTDTVDGPPKALRRLGLILGHIREP